MATPPTNTDSIREMQAYVNAWAVEKGWWQDFERTQGTIAFRALISEKLLLITSEIVEALEEVRNGHSYKDVYEHDGKPEGFPVEVADGFIRILDLCGYLGIDLSAETARKMAYNETRAFRHGGKEA